MALFFTLFYKRKANLLTIVCYSVIFISIVSVFVNYLTDIGFFRLYNILSGRELLWKAGLKWIIKEPIWGYGYHIATLLSNEGLPNGSTHNLWLDYILTHGVVVFVVYLSIIVFSIYRGLKLGVSRRIMGGVVLLLLNSNTIVISLGGVGFLSLLFTVFLGICCNYSNICKYYKLSKWGYGYDKNSL